MAPRRGRSPAKHETAAGLINALNFIACLKAPTTTSMPQCSHVWMDMGMAIGFDGVVAAGHPIEDGITGYPHAKLLAEALDNTDKNFTLTVRENGAFEINSGKYQALVPALERDQLIVTQPDMNQGRINNGAAFVKALETVGKITTETGDKVLYSAIRLYGDGTAMATDSVIIMEAYHGEQTPPGIILPKQFVTALVKCGKTPVGMGVNHDWSTFTVWFEDGAWLRTATYPADTWPETVDKTYADLLSQPTEPAEIPAKLWTTAKALLPFTEGNNRVIIRPGLARTNPDRRIGAALEVPDLAFSLDIDAKRLLTVEGQATRFAIGAFHGGGTFVFYGEGVRGVIAGLAPLEEPPEPTQAAQGGWGMSAGAVAPAPEEGQQTEPQGWNGIPAGGLAGDPEYESERQGIPVEDIPVVEDAYIFTGPDIGIPLTGVTLPEPQFVPSEWANNLKDVGEE